MSPIKESGAGERVKGLGTAPASRGKDEMITRSIRIGKHDMEAVTAFFESREQTFTQGVRLIIKEWMRENGVM